MLFWGTGAWISANASNTFPCQFHSLCLLHFQEEKLPLESLAFCTLREMSTFAELMGCGDIPVTLRKLLIYLEATEQDDRQGAWNTWILVRHLLICSNAQFRRKLATTSLYLPPQAEQKGKSDMNLVSADICRSVSSACAMYREWHNSWIWLSGWKGDLSWILPYTSAS